MGGRRTTLITIGIVAFGTWIGNIVRKILSRDDDFDGLKDIVAYSSQKIAGMCSNYQIFCQSFFFCYFGVAHWLRVVRLERIFFSSPSFARLLDSIFAISSCML